MPRAYVERVGEGNGEGTGTGAPFPDKPPPPRLSRKGALRAGSSINAPIRDNRGEGGGFSRKGVLSSLLYQLFVYFYFFISFIDLFIFSLFIYFEFNYLLVYLFIHSSFCLASIKFLCLTIKRENEN